MAVALKKSSDEIRQMPLVELVYEILKTKREPLYFRDIMREIQTLRSMSDSEVQDVIARLYTEVNVDGRFTCVGQNVWGLIRWYPVDKTSHSGVGKKFIRRSGDAFSEEDEEDAFEEDAVPEEDADAEVDAFADVLETADDLADEDDLEDADGDDTDEEFTEEPLLEEDEEDDEEEDED